VQLTVGRAASEEIHRYIATAERELRLVVWDVSTSVYVDLASVRRLNNIPADPGAG
jgi:hypothetical protein